MSTPKLSALQEFVFYRTYSRWLEDKKRRETFNEVFGPVGEGRYLSYMHSKFGDKVPERVWTLIESRLSTLGALGSMRAAWTAGPALEANNITGYNCACIAFNDLQSVVELFYILMCGTGVGFSVEKTFTDKMPTVEKQTGIMVGTHTVQDSKEGWADSLKIGLETWFSGKDVRFDFSSVRPSGARLKTMGGRASGPDPLRKLLDFTKDTVVKAQGRKLNSIEWLDIGNMVGEVVVVGGVRRSSEISFSDLDDDAMRHAKDWPFPLHRSMSNNSAAYLKKPGMVTFMREWAALAASGTGERGIFNLEAAKKASPRRAKFLKEAGLEHLLDSLRTNPCGEINLISSLGEFCVAGDTDLILRHGIGKISDLVGRDVEIWNGKNWSLVTPVKTGEGRDLYRVSMSDGSFLDVTGHHRFSVKTRFQKEFKEMSVKDIVGIQHDYALQCEPFSIEDGSGVSVKDSYTLGFAVGDGCCYDGKVLVDLYGEKTRCPVQGVRYKSYKPAGYNVERTRVNSTAHLSPEQVMSLKTSSEALDELFSWDRASILNFFAGLADSDGSETKTGGIRIYISEEHRARKMQLLLTRAGVTSSVNLCSPAGSATNLGLRTKAMWYLQITDCSSIPCHRLDVSKGHKPKFKGKYQSIRSVELLDGVHDTFCFEEKDRHMAVFGNTLTYQCNLTEVVIRATDTFDDLCEKVKGAVWLGAMQACLTDFPYLRPSWKQTCEQERLLGVSLTGQMDNPRLMTAEKLAILKDYAIKVCRKACKALGINMSAAITTGKPSGTVSQLVNCASGAHPRYAHFYTRRVRIAATDPLCKMLKAQGVPMSPENGQRPSDIIKRRTQKVAEGFDQAAAEVLVPDFDEDKVMTWVVGFPEAAPKGSITRDQVTAIEQLEWYLKLKQNWCEHNQSITVYVRDEEWLKVGNWVFENWDDISGISFLPYDNGHYEQAPYEELTEANYKEVLKNMPIIDYSALSDFEQEDNTSGSKSYACSGDSCEVI